jgi:spermidine synthase
MTPPTFLVGMTFPLVNRIGIRDMKRLGTGVGFLYFANTFGSILGSLAAGFLVLPWLGAKGGILVTAGLNVVIGVVALGARLPRRPPEVAVAGAVALAALLVAPMLARSGRDVLSNSQGRADTVLFRREDSVAETRVYRKPGGALHMSVDGYDIGGSETAVLRKEKLLAHLPMALVPRGREVLAVGLGSGITLGSLALHREIESLVVVEIVPGVVDGAELFREHHGNVLDDPRTEIHVEDGIQYLLTCGRRFDVISSDSKLNPDYVGNAALLSRDYYALCRDHLTDHGVMVQWVALHLPVSEMRTIAHSFAREFPHRALFWHYPNSVVLAGSRNPVGVDLDRVRSFLEDEPIREDLASVHLDDAYGMASLYVTGEEALLDAVRSAPVCTWFRPRLEFSVLKSGLSRSVPVLEDGSLEWLLAVRRPGEQTVRGAFEPETLDRFHASAGKLLEGYGAGGGVNVLATGTLSFREGLARNPEDRRLRHIVDFLEADARRQEGE